MTRCVQRRTSKLFSTTDGIQSEVRDLSTRKGFAALYHEFFSRFAFRFLMYHLGRELSLHVGGHGRFADRPAHTAFVRDLEIHCHEATLVVRDFAGDWYKKNHFETGITENQAVGFAAHCFTKLGDEIERRGVGCAA